jgi:valyl-tRNA synthetase
LRFTLASMAAQGRDIKLSNQRVEGSRNFATKLWNAARFAEMNEARFVTGFDPRLATETLNKWIAHELAGAAREITRGIEDYKFNEAAGAAYRFVWNVYCDWYLELVKPVLTGPDSAAKAETRAMVAWVRDEALKLLHPFMPFITEELWGVTASTPRSHLLALGEWPEHQGLDNPEAEAEIGWVVDLVTATRSVRSEMNITVATPLALINASAASKARATRWTGHIMRLARVSEIFHLDAPSQGSVQLLVRGEVAALPLKGIIDVAAEQARLAKEMAKADADIKRVDAKLNNADFVKRAPEEIIEGEKEKREEAEARRGKIADALERLAQAT